MSMASFPRLKPGVQHFNTEYGTFAGFSHRGIEITSLLAPQILRMLDGSRSLQSICKGMADGSSGLEDTQEFVSEVSQILSALHSANLIEFRSSALHSYQDGDFAAVNLVNTTNRMRAEENLYSWHEKVGLKKSAEELICERLNFAIIIFGQNRLALSLFSILQASGFSRTRLIDRSINQAQATTSQISPDQVCGMAIRGSDVGQRKELVIADLARNSRLLHEAELSFPIKPDFIISTENMAQDTLQRWMSEAIPHLSISNLMESKITLGPIVLPGISPCLNCLSLWRSEQFPLHKEFELLAGLENRLEMPAGQVALLSGLIAINVIEFCATLQSKLIGLTQTIDLLDPTLSEKLENRYWQPHMDCGCQQLI